MPDRQIERPRHRPIPRRQDIELVELEWLGEPIISATAATPKHEGRFAFSSTRSRQASFRLRYPGGAAGPCLGLYTSHQVVAEFTPPIKIGKGHEFVIDPAAPIRLERFGGRLPDRIYAGFERPR